jgi:hypothetical protein
VTRVTNRRTRQAVLVVGDPIDPAMLPEEIQFFNEDGDPLILGAYPRETREYVTASLADGEIGLGVFTVYKGWRALWAETDIPARVRIYASAAQRTADLSRRIGVTPIGDHGLLFELVTTLEDLSYTLSPKVDLATDDISSNGYYMAVTNLSGDPDTVTVTFNLVRTE